MEHTSPLHLPATGLSRHRRQQLLAQNISHLQHKQQHFAGFQTNQRSQMPAELLPLWQMNLVNLGDCWHKGYYQLNSKAFERAVLAWYARLWQLDAPWWGYITAMGATEGNLYSLWAARDYLQKKHGRAPVVVCASNSHYSIQKAAHLLGLMTPRQQALRDGWPDLTPDIASSDIAAPRTDWPDFVPCNEQGQLDVAALRALVAALHQRQQPMILVLTLGCTFYGHADDWRQFADSLLADYGSAFADHGWLHLDGALAGNYLPLSHAPKLQQRAPDFRHPLLHSACCSPYKWLGLPFPVGVVLLRAQYQASLPHYAHYTGSPDTTIAGSRSGLAAVLLWQQLARASVARQQRQLRQLQQRLQWFEQQLQTVLQQHQDASRPLRILPRADDSLVLVFSAPNPLICHQFSLPVCQLTVDAVPHRCCHLVLLAHCNKRLLQRLLATLRQPGAFTA